MGAKDRPVRVAEIKRLLRANGEMTLKAISGALGANLTDTVGDMAVLVNRGHVRCERKATEASFGQKVPVYELTELGKRYGG